MFPCRLSIKWEKRFSILLRRPSPAEGSSSVTSSGNEAYLFFSGLSLLGVSAELGEGEVLETSANCRT